MFEIKAELRNRVWICETDNSFMIYDRNSGNVHFAKNEKELEKIVDDLALKPEIPTVFVESKDNSFKINLSTVCNLHCDYCFRDKESHISTNVAAAKEIIDFILDVYAPDLNFYSFAFNMTSEALFELDKLKLIKSYLDERLNIYFDLKDVSSLDKGLSFLSCFDSALTGKLENYKTAGEIVNKLNDLLRFRKLKDYFKVPDGMVVPEWEKNQLERMDNLSEKEVVLANRRFLEFLFPDCFVHKANYVFYICTNGTICNDEVFEFLKEIDLKKICISLDGPASVHDKHRYFYNGNASHNLVVKNIRKYIEEGFEVEIAAVMTRDFLRPLKLAEYFKELNVSSLSLNVVRSGKSSSLTKDDAGELLKGYEELFEKIFVDAVKGDYSLIRLLKNDICFAAVKHVLVKNRLVKRCRWNEELVFDSKGDIYPCDYFIGRKAFSKGSIESGKIKDVGKGKIFADEREPCRNCWAKFMCAGTCFYNSFTSTGDFGIADPVECLVSKGIRELGLKLIHKLYLAGVSLYEFGKNIGFEFDTDLEFEKEFYVENGILYEFSGTLAGFEKELKKMYAFLDSKSLKCDKEIFVSVENVKDIGQNKIMDFTIIVPAAEEIGESLVEDTEYVGIKDFNFGNNISVCCVSNDSDLETAKNKIYDFVEGLKVPVKGHLFYKAQKEAFWGVQNIRTDVFIRQMENVI